MKKLYITFIFIFAVFSLSAQYPGGDTTVATINFDSGNTWMNYITFDSTHGKNCWQVGQPSKTLFDSAYSPNSAIMTDTTNPYPVNDTSSFMVTFKDTSIYCYPFSKFGYVISFYQKYDFEINKDLGIIEYWDLNDSTWYNIDSIFSCPNTEKYYYVLNSDSSICNNVGNWTSITSELQQSDLKTLANGLTGFTGRDSTWKHIAIFFNTAYFGVKPRKAQFKLRFTIISDSVQTAQEGWLIDDFKLTESKNCYIWEGIDTYENQKDIKIFPNPAGDKMRLKIEGIQIPKNTKIVIYGTLGRQVKTIKLQSNNQEINIADLSKGMYYLLLKKEGQVIASKSFVKD